MPDQSVASARNWNWVSLQAPISLECTHGSHSHCPHLSEHSTPQASPSIHLAPRSSPWGVIHSSQGLLLQAIAKMTLFENFRMRVEFAGFLVANQVSVLLLWSVASYFLVWHWLVTLQEESHSRAARRLVKSRSRATGLLVKSRLWLNLGLSRVRWGFCWSILKTGVSQDCWSSHRTSQAFSSLQGSSLLRRHISRQLKGSRENHCLDKVWLGKGHLEMSLCSMAWSARFCTSFDMTWVRPCYLFNLQLETFDFIIYYFIVVLY